MEPQMILNSQYSPEQNELQDTTIPDFKTHCKAMVHRKA